MTLNSVKAALLFGAELLDAYRIFPRIFVAAYLFGVQKVMFWAMALPDISVQQAGFISVAASTLPFVLNFYMQSGRQWQKDNSYAQPNSLGAPPTVYSNSYLGSGAVYSPVPLHPEVSSDPSSARYRTRTTSGTNPPRGRATGATKCVGCGTRNPETIDR